MKKVLHITIVLLIVLLANLVSEVPTTISYQGVLCTNEGMLVPDGNYNLAFGLYTSESGGSAIWTETHYNIEVTQGRFSLMLGSVNTTLGSYSFAEPYWLGISVNGGLELPRIQMNSSAYSLNAKSVTDNAITSSKILDGTINLNDIGQNGATLNKIIKWNGSAWAIANDSTGSGGGSGDITAVIAGNGLTGGATTGDATLNIGAGTGISVTSNAIALTSGYSSGSSYDSRFVNESQTNSVNSSMITNGSIQLGDIGQNGATTNKIIKWNGSAWAIANDSTGSGGVSDHGALSGLGDDDHQQYLLISRSGYVSEYTGRFDIQQSGGSRLLDFMDNGGSRIGMFKIVSGDNLTLVADGAFLNIGSEPGVVITDESGTSTNDIYASAFNVAKSAPNKTDIKYLSEEDYKQALNIISNLKLITFQIEGESQLGLNVEEAPSEILAQDYDAIDLYSLTIELAAAVKALQAQVEEQSEIIKELQGQ
jgi:hypothetical protein